MRTFKNDLTNRQYKLYAYLKAQTEYKNLRDIMMETGLYGDVVDNIHNSSGARALRKDIRSLKESNIIQYVILSNKNGIKLATKEEYEEYSKRRWRAIERVIKLQKTQDKKAGLDGQVRLVFGQEKPVIEAFREA